MSSSSARLILVFSSLGHFFMHLFAVYFFLIVLPLERDWGTPYHQLINLWTIGALLIGVLALPAGWLADRWSAPGMVAISFVGLGLAAIVCGVAPSPSTLWAGLCLLGAFAAIYHPVGIPWLVRNAETRGKALGVNGIFGSVGVAGGGLVAGTLIDLSGWRVAFLVPGAVSVLTGLVMVYCLRAGLIGDRPHVPSSSHRASRGDRVWTVVVLLLTMFCGSIIYQTTQTALPKLFAVRLVDLDGDGALGVGAMVAVVYGFAGVSQVVAGHLADRLPLKVVYLGAFLLQIPMLWLMASLGGPLLVGVAAAAAILNAGALPAENMLLADTAPSGRQGLAFGIKFVLAFGAAPLAIRLVSYINSTTGGFGWVFLILAGLAVVSCVAALMLPAPRRVPLVGSVAVAGN